ncbi:MAG: helix-turn-helix domain-containing protein [Chloroflexota bacterium]|jgi:excisionase family DNA binding protein|nr:helix-turn-helix domain-containing protein [Chloroflexota bacterium]
MQTVSDSPSARSKRSNLPPATYSLAQVAGLLGVSYATCHEMAQAGTLPVTPIRLNRQYRFPKAIVDRLLGLDDATGEQPDPSAKTA